MIAIMIAGHAHMLILTPIAHIEHVISTARHNISHAFHTLHRAPIAPGGRLAQRSAAARGPSPWAPIALGGQPPARARWYVGCTPRLID